MEENVYGWKQLSQWEINPPDAFVEYRPIKTALSKGMRCRMLVKITDMGSGVTRHEHVPKDEVNLDMIHRAGK